MSDTFLLLGQSKKLVPPAEGFSLKHTYVAEVIRLIRKLNDSSRAGVSCISTRIFKACADELAPSLVKLFNFCIDHSCQPDEWKFAFVHPLYKGKRAVDDRDNYRGISIFPPISKVFERVVASQITCYFENNSLFFGEQHGFRPIHSCETALQSILDVWKKSLDYHQVVMSLYVDFKKAFDLINSDLHFHK